MIKASTAIARVFPGMTLDEALQLAAAENIQREDLTHLEKAELCLIFQDQGKKRVEIAKIVLPTASGIEGECIVAKYLTVAKTDPKIKEALAKDKICFTIAIRLADAVISKMASEVFTQLKCFRASSIRSPAMDFPSERSRVC